MQLDRCADLQCDIFVLQTFIQFYNNVDPGTLVVTGALAALNAVDPESLSASNAGQVTASPYAPLGLDPTCLARCGLPSTGVGLSGIDADMAVCTGFLYIWKIVKM